MWQMGATKTDPSPSQQGSGQRAGQEAPRKVSVAQSHAEPSPVPWAVSHPRSPPRPSPGGLHYSDEDICNKYNSAVLTESTNLKEKSVDASESEVSACGRCPHLWAEPSAFPRCRLPGPHRVAGQQGRGPLSPFHR